MDSTPEVADPREFGFGPLFCRVREAVIVGDTTTGKIALWNPAAQAIFGYSADEAVGQRMDVLVPDALKERHRRGLDGYARSGHGSIVDGGKPVELPALAKGGKQLWVELSLSGLDDTPRNRRYVLAVIRDVTERKRAEEERLALASEQAARAEAQEQADVHVRLSAALRALVEERDAALANAERARERLAFLAEASREMGGSLEYEITLATVARLAVPALADWCAVDILAEDGSIQRLAVEHVDPAKVELARDIARRYPPRPDATGGVPGVIRSGRAELHPDVSEALLVKVARDAEHLALLRRLGLSSAVIVPIAARDRVLGALTLVSAESGRRYNEADLALADELAQRAAVAVDNARLYREATERASQAELIAQVGVALTRGSELPVALQHCAEAMVHHLDAAFARVWTLEEAEQVLVLRASAGMYTHLDGPHGRVPIGAFKIGLIAQERLPHLTNDVLSDPRLNQPDWARREGMVAFAGYPLTVGDRVVGVMALFARRRLPDTTLQVLGTIADGVALAIDRARAEADREQLLAELREGITVRDDFLAAASHDLKNPLTAVSGSVQMVRRALARGALSPDRLAAGLDTIEASSKRMAGQIDELLDVARLQLGADLPLERAPTDLVALGRDRADAHQAGSERHHIALQTNLPRLIGAWDERRIVRVLDNLIGNAVKYSPGGGEITIEVAQEATWAVVTVRDQGIGIPAADKARLFERFHRAANVRGRIVGTGIGLMAARQVVEQHRGQIDLISEEGVGTCAIVRLPLIPDDGSAADRSNASSASSTDTSLQRGSV